MKLLDPRSFSLLLQLFQRSPRVFHEYSFRSVFKTIISYRRDVTWTLAPGGGPANATVQRVHCRCRPSSVPYLVRRQPHTSPDGNQGFLYSFACSPQSVSRKKIKYASVFIFKNFISLLNLTLLIRSEEKLYFMKNEKKKKISFFSYLSYKFQFQKSSSLVFSKFFQLNPSDFFSIKSTKFFISLICKKMFFSPL